MRGVLTFRILIVIPSYPRVFLNFSDVIIFSISLGFVYFSFIFEQGSLKFLGRQCVCVCVELLQLNEVLSYFMLIIILLVRVKNYLLKECNCLLISNYVTIHIYQFSTSICMVFEFFNFYNFTGCFYFILGLSNIIVVIKLFCSLSIYIILLCSCVPFSS